MATATSEGQVTPPSQDVRALKGLLAPPKKPVSIGDMKTVIRSRGTNRIATPPMTDYNPKQEKCHES